MYLHGGLLQNLELDLVGSLELLFPQLQQVLVLDVLLLLRIFLRIEYSVGVV